MAGTFGDNDVLVVVDMQNAFAAGDWGTPHFADAARIVEQVRAACPRPAVLTRFLYDADEPGSWHAYYDRWPAMRLPQDDSAWELAIPVQPGDVIVTLPTFSKWGPQLAGLAGPDSRIVLCGVATECCVIATALAAVDAGRAVAVVTDACAGATVEDHTRALELLALMSPMVELVTSVDITG